MPTVTDLRFTRPVETVRLALAAALVRPAPPAGRDIYIVSSPRSGSTWLMEAIGAQPGFGCVNEPLHRRRLECLPDPGFAPRWRYDEVEAGEAEALIRHLTDRKSLRAFLNIHPLRPSFCRNPDRLVIKMVRSTPILGWLVEHLPGHVIYLCRHPIPQAISASRRSHALRGCEYLERARSGRPSIATDAAEALARHVGGGDELAGRVVEWSLENLPAIRWVREHPDDSRLTVVRYEDVVRDLGAVLRRLDARIDLPDWTLSMDESDQPSRVTDSSTAESVRAIREGNADHLVRGWRKDMDPDRIAALLSIPRLLGIPVDHEDDAVRI